jgi:hypothetical protein
MRRNTDKPQYGRRKMDHGKKHLGQKLTGLVKEQEQVNKLGKYVQML